MKSSTSILRVPSTVPVFNISVVLVTGSFFVAMIFTLGIRLLSFPADVVHLVVLVSCLSVWMTISVVPAPVLDMQSAILCNRPLYLVPCSVAVGPFVSVSGPLLP